MLLETEDQQDSAELHSKAEIVYQVRTSRMKELIAYCTDNIIY